MRQDGIALVAALWLTVMLTVIASGFAFSMHSEALSARNALSVAQARAAADGAVERVAFELGRPRTSQDVWMPDGQVRTWKDGDATITATATDEASRIDLNAAPEPLLKGMLQNIGELDAASAQALAEKILDWRDPDDLVRPNGAEANEYAAAGRTYGPANGPFNTVGEVQRVLTMTPGLAARLADVLTVYSRQPGINLATAPREVLLAIPGTTPEQIDQFIAQRADAIANKLAIPLLPQAQPFSSSAAPVWRIRAEAALPDGVTFVRDAVLRPSSDPQRPVIALLWQEGTRLGAPATAAAATAAPDQYGTGRR
jgi:general secretion pathway protein K